MNQLRRNEIPQIETAIKGKALEKKFHEKAWRSVETICFPIIQRVTRFEFVGSKISAQVGFSQCNSVFLYQQKLLLDLLWCGLSEE